MINLALAKRLFVPAYFPHLFDYANRYEVYYGGAGSGKSHFIAQKILVKCCREKRKILVIRKVAATLKDSVWQVIIDLLTQWQLIQYCKINLTTLTITMPNGSILLFKGLDDSEKIKSIAGITDIWIEEATELTEDDFTQLDLRLRAKAPYLQLLLSFNPISKTNWCYKHWFEQTQPNTIIIRTTYKDNPFLSEDYIRALEQMANTDPVYYRIYALGEFASLNKLIYNNWEISEAEPPRDAPLIVGLDYGYASDPTALIVGQVDEQNRIIYITDEHYERGMLNNQIADLLKYKGLHKSIIVADCAEPKSIEEMRRAGITRIRPSTKGQGSISYGIQKLQQYKILVDPKCANTITELQNYSYRKDKQSGEYTNEPIDDYNHLMDALRYAIQIVDNKQRLMTTTKAIFGL